ncbi:hypothetical protein [Pelomonas aquatica]|jgi:hypothetical protein|uniref:Uncharacterized protein n=1 Tax=Pelomonas aquatica TaxID=431058 RepID=A0A9X4LES3_9BURK|nr:hypothetical protein [Pelomonas aquatica]MCY4755269.1 hypothetical protein [Pelomonas aquatica]MDG0862576.1 hypothetical protein [Pelomonas aquatica]
MRLTSIGDIPANVRALLPRRMSAAPGIAAGILFALGASGCSSDPREDSANEEMARRAHASAWTLSRAPAGHYLGGEYAGRQQDLNGRPATPVASAR